MESHPSSEAGVRSTRGFRVMGWEAKTRFRGWMGHPRFREE